MKQTDIAQSWIDKYGYFVSGDETELHLRLTNFLSRITRKQAEKFSSLEENDLLLAVWESYWYLQTSSKRLTGHKSEKVSV